MFFVFCLFCVVKLGWSWGGSGADFGCRVLGGKGMFISSAPRIRNISSGRRRGQMVV